VDPWVDEVAGRIAGRAERELRILVGVSSPSGDTAGAEESLAIAAALAPDEAVIERVPCSTPAHADDLVARLRGDGDVRLLLLGHVDTVVAHAEHRVLEDEGERLAGSGTSDMKGGVVLALGVLRALTERAPEFAEVALLLVCDEEWRTAEFTHVERFAGFDACLCFEAGQLTPAGDDAVVVRRKAAATLTVRAAGRAAHSGSAPDRGANALLALAVAAQAVAACHDPAGPDALTAVPTILRSGDAFNVVPAAGELVCDLRADSTGALEGVIGAVPDHVGGVALSTRIVRLWPGMDSTAATAALLLRAAGALGRPVVGAARGGASDASHFAGAIPLTVDGLGPRGGGAHTPHEYLLRDSLRSRAEVALAIVDAILRPH
jgi:glutamate carboxypeptidase